MRLWSWWLGELQQLYNVTFMMNKGQLGFIILLTLKVHGVENHGKRKIWLLFSMVFLQPLIMWWLTYSLIPSYTFLSPAMEMNSMEP